VRVVAKTFSLPDVQPGSIIEYRYEMGFRGEYLRDTRFTVQRDLPVLHEMLWLRPFAVRLEVSYTSFFVYRGLPAGKKPIKNADGHFELELENIPAYEREPYSLPDGELKPVVNFFYAAGQIDIEAFWKKEGKEWTDLIEDFIGRDRAAVRTAADAAIAGAKTQEEKLRKLYFRAQQIRNLSFENEKTEAESRKVRDNRSVEDVLRNGYGYPSEINRTFIALARAGGFEANAVRIGERDESIFARNLPIARQLDGEIAVVKLDSGDFWVDAGTPYAPLGVVAWQKTDVPGIKLARKQDALWVTTPRFSCANALIERRAVLRAEDGSLKGKVTLTYRGQEALQRRLVSRNDDEAATKKALEESAKRHLPEGTSVTLTKVTGMKTSEDAVVADFEVEIPNLGSFAGSRALIPLAVFDVGAKNPFAEAERKFEVTFDYLRSEASDVTLAVPEGYVIETMPSARKIDFGAVVYENHYEVTGGGTLHFTRELSISTPSVPVEKYSAIRAFFAKTAAADQEQVVLRKAAPKVAN
jgi:transglutaminase-like putative cysteine protease